MTNQRRLTQHKTAEHENQNRTEISEGRSLVYLVVFVKLVLRQGNIVCLAVLSLLIVKTNSLVIF